MFGVLFASVAFRTFRDEDSFSEVLRRPLHLIKGMLTDPTKTFEAVRENTLGEAVLYFIAWTVIFILGSVALTELFGMDGGVYPILENLGDGSILGTVFTLMILLFLVVFLMVVVVWLINFACALFGARNGYDETAKSLIYGSTPGYILGWLPFLLLIPLAWSIVNQGIGFKVLHGLTTKRVISVTLSIIMISILFFVIYSVFF